MTYVNIGQFVPMFSDSFSLGKTKVIMVTSVIISQSTSY